MIAAWSLGLTLIYCGGVLAYNSKPESLLEVHSESLAERLRGRYGMLVLGSVLLLGAGVSFAPGSGTVDPLLAYHWGLIPKNPFSFSEIFRSCVASLLHWDIPHLLANVFIIPFLLPYEKRVGGMRVLLVFVLCATVVQFMEDLLPLGLTISLGASGGLCGLITAYNLDRRGMRASEWFTRLLLSLLLIGFVSLQGVLHSSDERYSVDWIAHLLAVPTAAVLCLSMNRISARQKKE